MQSVAFPMPPGKTERTLSLGVQQAGEVCIEDTPPASAQRSLQEAVHSKGHISLPSQQENLGFADRSRRSGRPGGGWGFPNGGVPEHSRSELPRPP